MDDLTEDLYSEEVEMIYGELDENLIFHPMTEDQMVRASLAALDEYRAMRNGNSDDLADRALIETADDELTAGSKQWMSHQERQAFVKNRVYAATEPTEMSQ
jgi:hypothetical protein